MKKFYMENCGSIHLTVDAMLRYKYGHGRSPLEWPGGTSIRRLERMEKSLSVLGPDVIAEAAVKYEREYHRIFSEASQAARSLGVYSGELPKDHPIRVKSHREFNALVENLPPTEGRAWEWCGCRAAELIGFTEGLPGKWVRVKGPDLRWKCVG